MKDKININYWSLFILKKATFKAILSPPRTLSLKHLVITYDKKQMD